MPDFLTNLYQEIQNTPITDFDLDEEPSEEEVVLGEAGDTSKKIWSLHASLVEEGRKKIQQHAQFHVDHMFNGNGSDNSHDCEDFHEELCDMKRKARLLKDLFWMSVQQDIGVTKENLKITHGWKVVRVEKSAKEQLEEMVIGSLLDDLFE